MPRAHSVSQSPLALRLLPEFNDGEQIRGVCRHNEDALVHRDDVTQLLAFVPYLLLCQQGLLPQLGTSCQAQFRSLCPTR